MDALRLLAISNTYPPTARGGYGELCADVMERLAARGHDVTVLTERAGGAAGDRAGVDVRRVLAPALGAWRRPPAGWRALRNDAEAVASAIGEGVDVALVWHMRGLVKPPLRLLDEAAIPVVYLVHDRWPLYERPGSLAVPWRLVDRLGLDALREGVGRRLARRIELRAPRVQERGTVLFVSDWLRDELAARGFTPHDARVVGAGIDVARYAAPDRDDARPVRSVLALGRVDRQKGVDVALRAIAAASAPLTLTIAGHEQQPRWSSRMRDLAARLGIADRVRWAGEVPRERLPALLAEHDALVFPSRVPESFGLVVYEAMAAGAVVLSCAPGAPAAALSDGHDALLFEPDDHRALAGALETVATDVALCERLRVGGRATARAASIERMVDEVEGVAREVSVRGAR